MCGRFTLTVDPDELQEAFGLADSLPAGLAPRYNIAPSQPVAASQMKAAPVSTRVNNPAFDAPECITPV